MPPTMDDLRAGTIHTVKDSLDVHENVVRDYVTSEIFAVSEYECVYIALIECVYSSMQKSEVQEPNFIIRNLSECGYGGLFRSSDFSLSALKHCVLGGPAPSTLPRLKDCAVARDRLSFYRHFLDIPPESLQWPRVDASHFGPRKLAKEFAAVRNRLKFGLDSRNFEFVQLAPSSSPVCVVSSSLVHTLVRGAASAIGNALFERMAREMQRVNRWHDSNARATEAERLLRWYGVDPGNATGLCTVEDVVQSTSSLEVTVSNAKTRPSTVICTFVSRFDRGQLVDDENPGENWNIKLPESFPQDKRL